MSILLTGKKIAVQLKNKLKNTLEDFSRHFHKFKI